MLRNSLTRVLYTSYAVVAVLTCWSVRLQTVLSYKWTAEADLLFVVSWAHRATFNSQIQFEELKCTLIDRRRRPT